MFKRMCLPFKRIWKSPYWQSSDALYKYLTKRKFTVAIDPNQPDPEVKDMKTYKFNWSIEQEMPDVDIVKAHGHCYSTQNDIRLCIPNVLREMPTDAEFLFVSEYMKKYA